MKRPGTLTIDQAREAARKIVSHGQRGAVDASVVEIYSIAVLTEQLGEVAETAAAFFSLNDNGKTDEDRELAVLAQIRLRQLLGLSGLLTSNAPTEQRGN